MAQDKKAESVVRNEGERKIEEVTRKRVAFGVPKSKMTVDMEIEGYHLHWINDEPGRIYKAQQGGYEFVSPNEVGVEDSGDGKVKISAGTLENGERFFAYLMKLRQDWYDEDREQIHAVQRQFEDAIKQGELNRTPNDGRYVPKGGINIR